MYADGSERERLERTALHDLDLAAEDLNCKIILFYSDISGKILASYMRRHSVCENPTDNQSYTYTYIKNSLYRWFDQYHNHINKSFR